MRVVLDHALPNKLDYMKLLVETNALSFYLLLDGRSIFWSGRVGKPGGVAFRDAEYAKYRMIHPIEKVLFESCDSVVVKTKEGTREHWRKPLWILERIERFLNSKGSKKR